MTNNDTEILSLFETDDKNETETSQFSVAGALLLSGIRMTDWWEITLSIFLWMVVSFVIFSIGASLISLFSLRKHPYVCFMIIPFFIMTFLIPLVFGAPTSMVLAFAMYASKNAVSTWYCMVMGLMQTILIFIISVTRLHATL